MSPGRILLTRAASFVAVGVFLWIIQVVLYPFLQSLGGFDNRLITLSALFGVLAVSLNLINGITGQFSIGHAAFYMIGAYATGYFTIQYYQPGQMEEWVWLLLMVGVGALAAGIAGFVVGLPSLRLRGD